MPVEGDFFYTPIVDVNGQYEIERKFLLKARPAIPERAERLSIRQGYLNGSGEGDVPGGRLRRIEHADGRVSYVHTVKRGRGLVREEQERLLSAEEFEALWPRTAGARLSKTRYRLREGDCEWVVDIFDDRDLLLAEVELPCADRVAEPPGWLAGCIEREVTEEDSYTNAAIAC